MCRIRRGVGESTCDPRPRIVAESRHGGRREIQEHRHLDGPVLRTVRRRRGRRHGRVRQGGRRKRWRHLALGLHVHLGRGIVARARCRSRLVAVSGAVGSPNEKGIHNDGTALGPNSWYSRAARDTARPTPQWLSWRWKTGEGVGRRSGSSRSRWGRPRRSR